MVVKILVVSMEFGGSEQLGLSSHLFIQGVFIGTKLDTRERTERHISWTQGVQNLVENVDKWAGNYNIA